MADAIEDQLTYFSCKTIIIIMKPKFIGEVQWISNATKNQEGILNFRTLRMIENENLWMEPKRHYNLDYVLYVLHCSLNL